MDNIKSTDETTGRSRQFFKSYLRILTSSLENNSFYPNSFMQLLQQLSFSLSLSFVRSNKILAESMYLLQKIFPKGEHGGGLSVTRPIHQFGSIPLSSRVFTKDKSHPTPLVLWNERLEYHIAQMINRYHG